jgi:predicted RNase H-like nuclease (RuvC/YqgF family)
LQEDRTEKNRKAAVRSRLKKKNYLANLEITVDRLTKENKELAEEVNRLKLKLDHLSDK